MQLIFFDSAHSVDFFLPSACSLSLSAQRVVILVKIRSTPETDVHRDLKFCEGEKRKKRKRKGREE